MSLFNLFIIIWHSLLYSQAECSGKIESISGSKRILNSDRLRVLINPSFSLTDRQAVQGDNYF